MKNNSQKTCFVFSICLLLQKIKTMKLSKALPLLAEIATANGLKLCRAKDYKKAVTILKFI